MPDPFDPDFDATRRALDEVPAPDLWAEAERRAEGGAVVPLTVDGTRVRRPVRWLAVAAVAALAVGTVGVLTSGDDSGLDTAPAGEGPTTTCGISGLVAEGGPSLELRSALAGSGATLLDVEDLEGRVIVHDVVGSDLVPFEVTTPALTELTTAGKVEPVDLTRGPAVLFLAADLTQIQYDPDGDEPCTSFSVTLGAPNRKQEAITIANQVVLTRSGEPTVVGSDGCRFAVTGEEMILDEGPADPPLFEYQDQTVAHAQLGTDQVAEISVPGLVVVDLIGERVEPVELRRGTADVWFGSDFVQVRWFFGSTKECESFSVTVAGGTEDGNRHAAVDLADRIILPSELDLPSLRGTEWALERSTVGGEPTDGNGSTFTFRQNDVLWTDGCNEFNAGFTQDWGYALEVGGDDPTTEITSTAVGCDPNPTTDAIAAVMSAGLIDVAYDGDLLLLSAGDVVLTLRPVGGESPTTTVDQPPEGDLAYAIWPITYPGQPTGDLVYPMETTAETAVAFATDVLGWRDAEATDGEPSEDGRQGAVHLVESEEVGGAVSVWVAPGAGSDGFIVYKVDLPGRTSAEPQEASVSISGTTARVNISPVPGGTDHTLVKLLYGDQLLGEGSMDEDIALTAAPDVPGRILVFFNDADGHPISAWGTALPAGDFAAG